MARRTRRYYRRWPSPQQRSESLTQAQRALKVAARLLRVSRTPTQLQDELATRTARLVEADRTAQLEPNSANLARYREARASYEVIRMALGPIGNLA